METGGEPERAEPAAGVAAPNSIHTAVATPPPAPHETVGVPEPLLPELTPGEPATGGPARPSQPPSRPDSAKTPTTGMEQPPVVDRAAEAARRTSGRFVGNKRTRVYHPATSGDLPSERHRVYFDTEEEAGAAGFHPAGTRGQPGGGAKRPHR